MTKTGMVYIDRPKLFRHAKVWFTLKKKMELGESFNVESMSETNKRRLREKLARISESMENSAFVIYQLIQPIIKRRLQKRRWKYESFTGNRHDDLMSIISATVFKNIIPKFKFNSKKYGFHNHFYNYLVRGIDLTIKSSINRETRKREVRECNIAVEDSVLERKAKKDMTPEFERREMKTDIIRILGARIDEVSPCYRKVIHYLVKTEDFSVLSCGRVFEDSFNYSKESWRGFLAKSAKYCCG